MYTQNLGAGLGGSANVWTEGEDEPDIAVHLTRNQWTLGADVPAEDNALSLKSMATLHLTVLLVL